MTFKLVHIWKSVAGGLAFPSLLPGRDSEDENQAEASEEVLASRVAEEAGAARRRDEEDRRDRKASEDHDFLFLTLWLASEELQQALKRLLEDIGDIRAAVRLAYERAAAEETASREELERTQAQAIVLPDGRRVYFTREGRALFGEDLQEITNPAAIAEAEALRAGKPGAPDFETYLDRYEKNNAAAERAMQLADILHRIDDLNTRVSTGRLTPGELAEAQKEAREIISALPADARQNYERIREARQSGEVAYRDAGSALPSAPDIEAHFSKAGSQQPAQAAGAAAPGEDRQPAYRGPQDF